MIPSFITASGWTPTLSVQLDGARRVLQVVDWTGGDGPKPRTGLYVGASGFVELAADAVDIRGTGGDGGMGGLTQDEVNSLIAAYGQPYTQTEKDKLAASESGATADQTADEIITLIEGETGDDRLDANRLRNVPTAPPAASESEAGIVELADGTETSTGTDNAKAVSPSRLRGEVGAVATNDEVDAGTETGVRRFSPASIKRAAEAHGGSDAPIVWVESDITLTAAHDEHIIVVNGSTGIPHEVNLPAFSAVEQGWQVIVIAAPVTGNVSIKEGEAGDLLRTSDGMTQSSVTIRSGQVTTAYADKNNTVWHISPTTVPGTTGTGNPVSSLDITGNDSLQLTLMDASTITGNIQDLQTDYDITSGAYSGGTLTLTTRSGTVTDVTITGLPQAYTLPDATESVKGGLEVATNDETDTGTANDKIITPVKLRRATGILATNDEVDAGTEAGIRRISPALLKRAVEQHESASHVLIVADDMTLTADHGNHLLIVVGDSSSSTHVITLPTLAVAGNDWRVTVMATPTRTGTVQIQDQETGNALRMPDGTTEGSVDIRTGQAVSVSSDTANSRWDISITTAPGTSGTADGVGIDRASFTEVANQSALDNVTLAANTLEFARITTAFGSYAVGDVLVYAASAWRHLVDMTQPYTLPSASTTVRGGVELADNAAVDTGTDTVRAVTPANVRRATGATATNDEVDAGTEAGVRRFSPALVKRAVDQHKGTPPDASDSVKGLIEIADNTETDTGTDDTRAMTPAKVRRATGAVATNDEVDAGTETSVRRFSPALIKRAAEMHGGDASSVQVVADDQTLVLGDQNKLLIVVGDSSSSTHVITLPTFAVAGNDWRVTVLATPTRTGTVRIAAADAGNVLRQPDGTATATMDIRTGQAVSVSSDTTNNRWDISITTAPGTAGTADGVGIDRASFTEVASQTDLDGITTAANILEFARITTAFGSYEVGDVLVYAASAWRLLMDGSSIADGVGIDRVLLSFVNTQADLDAITTSSNTLHIAQVLATFADESLLEGETLIYDGSNWTQLYDLFALANAITALLPEASTTDKGLVELATSTEAASTTNSDTVLTPQRMHGQIGPQVSDAERTAGTATTIRRYSPADIKSMIDTHGSGASPVVVVADDITLTSTHQNHIIVMAGDTSSTLNEVTLPTLNNAGDDWRVVIIAASVKGHIVRLLDQESGAALRLTGESSNANNLELRTGQVIVASSDTGNSRWDVSASTAPSTGGSADGVGIDRLSVTAVANQTQLNNVALAANTMEFARVTADFGSYANGDLLIYDGSNWQVLSSQRAAYTLPDATETTKGGVEFADATEAANIDNTNRAINPQRLHGQIGAQVSEAERNAGTESAIRRFAPSDVKDMIDTHGGGNGGGGGSTAEVMRLLWDGVPAGSGHGLTASEQTIVFDKANAGNVADYEYLVFIGTVSYNADPDQDSTADERLMWEVPVALLDTSQSIAAAGHQQHNRGLEVRLTENANEIAIKVDVVNGNYQPSHLREVYGHNTRTASATGSGNPLSSAALDGTDKDTLDLSLTDGTVVEADLGELETDHDITGGSVAGTTMTLNTRGSGVDDIDITGLPSGGGTTTIREELDIHDLAAIDELHGDDRVPLSDESETNDPNRRTTLTALAGWINDFWNRLSTEHTGLHADDRLPIVDSQESPAATEYVKVSTLDSRFNYTLPDATETTKGGVQISDNGEADGGTDNATAMSPSKVRRVTGAVATNDEVDAGTETGVRRFSPALVKRAVEQHESADTLWVDDDRTLVAADDEKTVVVTGGSGGGGNHTITLPSRSGLSDDWQVMIVSAAVSGSQVNVRSAETGNHLRTSDGSTHNGIEVLSGQAVVVRHDSGNTRWDVSDTTPPGTGNPVTSAAVDGTDKSVLDITLTDTTVIEAELAELETDQDIVSGVVSGTTMTLETRGSAVADISITGLPTGGSGGGGGGGAIEIQKILLATTPVLQTTATSGNLHDLASDDDNWDWVISAEGMALGVRNISNNQAWLSLPRRIPTDGTLPVFLFETEVGASPNNEIRDSTAMPWGPGSDRTDSTSGSTGLGAISFQPDEATTGLQQIDINYRTGFTVSNRQYEIVFLTGDGDVLPADSVLKVYQLKIVGGSSNGENPVEVVTDDKTLTDEDENKVVVMVGDSTSTHHDLTLPTLAQAGDDWRVIVVSASVKGNPVRIFDQESGDVLRTPDGTVAGNVTVRPGQIVAVSSDTGNSRWDVSVTTAPGTSGSGNPVTGLALDSSNKDELDITLTDGTVVTGDLSELETDQDITNGSYASGTLTLETRGSGVNDISVTGLTQPYTLPSASTTVRGGVELADNTETDTGTDSTRAMTPATVRRATGATATNDEVDAGTEAGVRRFSPALVKRAVDQHAPESPVVVVADDMTLTSGHRDHIIVMAGDSASTQHDVTLPTLAAAGNDWRVVIVSASVKANTVRVLDQESGDALRLAGTATNANELTLRPGQVIVCSSDTPNSRWDVSTTTAPGTSGSGNPVTSLDITGANFDTLRLTLTDSTNIDGSIADLRANHDITGGSYANGTLTLTTRGSGVNDITVTGLTQPYTLPAATESTRGGAEIASDTETDNGSDNATIISPAKLRRATGTVATNDEVDAGTETGVRRISPALLKRAVEQHESASHVLVVADDMTLTADHGNHLIIVVGDSSSSTHVITLPAISATGNDWRVTVMATPTRTGTVQIQRAGSDLLLLPDGTTENSMDIRTGQTVSVSSNSANNRWNTSLTTAPGGTGSNDGVGIDRASFTEVANQSALNAITPADNTLEFARITAAFGSYAAGDVLVYAASAWRHLVDMTQPYTLPSASETTRGGVEISSDGEADAGTDNTTAMSPAKVRRVVGTAVTETERDAGTLTDIRRMSPFDVKDMIDTHGGGGVSSIPARVRWKKVLLATTPTLDFQQDTGPIEINNSDNWNWILTAEGTAFGLANVTSSSLLRVPRRPPDDMTLLWQFESERGIGVNRQIIDIARVPWGPGAEQSDSSSLARGLAQLSIHHDSGESLNQIDIYYTTSSETGPPFVAFEGFQLFGDGDTSGLLDMPVVKLYAFQPEIVGDVAVSPSNVHFEKVLLATSPVFDVGPHASGFPVNVGSSTGWNWTITSEGVALGIQNEIGVGDLWMPEFETDDVSLLFQVEAEVNGERRRMLRMPWGPVESGGQDGAPLYFNEPHQTEGVAFLLYHTTDGQDEIRIGGSGGSIPPDSRVKIYALKVTGGSDADYTVDTFMATAGTNNVSSTAADILRVDAPNANEIVRLYQPGNAHIGRRHRLFAVSEGFALQNSAGTEIAIVLPRQWVEVTALSATEWQLDLGSQLDKRRVSNLGSGQEGFTLGASHHGRHHEASFPADATVNIAQVANLGAGWFTSIRNAGTTRITLSPDGTEQINDDATLNLAPGSWAFLHTDGSQIVALTSTATGGATIRSTVPPAFTATAFIRVTDGTTPDAPSWTLTDIGAVPVGPWSPTLPAGTGGVIWLATAFVAFNETTGLYEIAVSGGPTALDEYHTYSVDGLTNWHSAYNSATDRYVSYLDANGNRIVIPIGSEAVRWKLFGARDATWETGSPAYGIGGPSINLDKINELLFVWSERGGTGTNGEHQNFRYTAELRFSSPGKIKTRTSSDTSKGADEILALRFGEDIDIYNNITQTNTGVGNSAHDRAFNTQAWFITPGGQVSDRVFNTIGVERPTGISSPIHASMEVYYR